MIAAGRDRQGTPGGHSQGGDDFAALVRAGAGPSMAVSAVVHLSRSRSATGDVGKERAAWDW